MAMREGAVAEGEEEGGAGAGAGAGREEDPQAQREGERGKGSRESCEVGNMREVKESGREGVKRRRRRNRGS